MVVARTFRIALALAAAAGLFACASKQRIALACVPEEVVVYVDGERLDEVPSELALRRDQPHTLYFKGPDIVPELIVLNSDEVSGKARLSPDEVCVKPRYLKVQRELQLEIDPDVASEPPPGAAETRSAIDVEPRPDFVPESP
jgi:hypothetical protein